MPAGSRLRRTSSHFLLLSFLFSRFPINFKGEVVMAQPEYLERDGFHKTKRVFTSPLNATLLDPVTKRKVTICNLFANHELPILDIVRVLDEEYRHVVNVLIEEGLVFERRRSHRGAAQAEPGRSVFGNRSSKS